MMVERKRMQASKFQLSDNKIQYVRNQILKEIAYFFEWFKYQLVAIFGAIGWFFFNWWTSHKSIDFFYKVMGANLLSMIFIIIGVFFSVILVAYILRLFFDFTVGISRNSWFSIILLFIGGLVGASFSIARQQDILTEVLLLADKTQAIFLFSYLIVSIGPFVFLPFLYKFSFGKGKQST